MIKLSKRRAWFMLAVLALTAYTPVIKLPFMWDDHVMIEQNPFLQSWSVSNLRHDLGDTVTNGLGDDGYLRPVVTWANRLDYTIWSLNPIGFHLTNLLLHTANGLLLFELFLILGASPIAAFLGASLFAVHPIGVEGIMIATGRATQLSFFFGLLALLMLAIPKPRRLVGGLGCFLLALLSKEQAVILPILALLVWEARKEPLRRYQSAALSLFALLGAYLLYRKQLFGSVGAPSDPLLTAKFFGLAFPRVLNHYLRLFLVPWDLHSHRLIMRLSHFWPMWLALWSAFAIWVWRTRQTHRHLFTATAWLIITLVPPSLAMVTGGFMLDHWGYWAAPAMCLGLGLGVEWTWMQQTYPKVRWMAAIYFPMLVGYALVTRFNIELRGSDEKMYRWALNFTTSIPIHFNLGLVLLESGRAREAIPYLYAAHEAYPNDLNAFHALGLAYWKAGRTVAAYKMLKDLHEKHPDFAPAAQSYKTVSVLMSQRANAHTR